MGTDYANNETVADIVREMRSEPLAENGAKPWLHYLADRIEKANSREIIVERNLSNDHILSLHDEIAAKDAENAKLRALVASARELCK